MTPTNTSPPLGRRSVLAAGTVAAAALWMPAVARGQARGAATDFAAVLDGARREGNLIVRVSSPGGPDTHKALFDAFKARFGLNVQAEWTPVSSVQTGTRVVAEAASGRGSVDVIGSGGAEEVSVLLNRQLLKPYPWAQVFGREFPAIGTIVDGVMAELKGMALPILDAAYGIAWNPQMIEERDVPAKMLDLLDPKWRGRFVANAQFLIPYEALTHVLGPDQAFDIARRLADNRPVLERGTPAVSRAVSVGQAPLGVTTFHSADRAARANEPQRFRLFTDYVPVYPLYVYVPETAPNPNAARLFAAWLVTEGAAVTNRFESVPRVGDPEDRLAKMVAAQRQATEAKILTPASLEQIAAAEPLRKRITDLLAGAGAR